MFGLNKKKVSVQEQMAEEKAQQEERWDKNTRKLKLGVVLATIMLVLYNGLLFFRPETGNTSQMIICVLFLVVAMALAFFCNTNYTRGISRFSNCFEKGAKRALHLVRWAFWLTGAGVVLQLIIAYMFLKPTTEAVEFKFLWILIANSLLIVATVVSVMSFLSLSTSKGMPDRSRRGALHMSWTSLLLMAGAILLTIAINIDNTFVKIATIVVNFTGIYFYYKNWDRILNPNKPEKVEIDPVTQEEETPNQAQ